MKLPQSVTDHIAKNSRILAGYSAKLAKLYENCYASTIDTALEKCEDGTYFVLTGDIPAMWLRDSSAQVNHYIQLCDDPEVAQIVKGVILRQMDFILQDPYANAFNKEANGMGMLCDRPKNKPIVWEHKYEVDSLCYPIKLLYRYWKKTGDDSVVKGIFLQAMDTILKVWQTEQHHFEKSQYRFFRDYDRLVECNPPLWNCDPVYTDTIHNDGMGAPVAYTGMTWSGFRPSDDGCTYGYYLPSNMFATVVLGYAQEMLADVSEAREMLPQIAKLQQEIAQGIQEYGIIDHPTYGKVYACEVDGYGNHRLMDDANIPSLISAPYLGYCPKDEPVYQSTRKLLLSKENPFYFEGTYAKGIGSPHTKAGYIWHLALSMQGLTTDDKAEKLEILDTMIATDADTGFMHEGFDANDPSQFSRPWFTWSNSLFCEFVESCIPFIKE